MTKNILKNLNLKEALQLARTKKKEKSYDEVVSICSDILLEFPHNKNARELLKELPCEDFFYRGNDCLNKAELELMLIIEFFRSLLNLAICLSCFDS